MSYLKLSIFQNEKQHINKEEKQDTYFPIFSNDAYNSIKTHQIKPQSKAGNHRHIRHAQIIPKMEELEDNGVKETNYYIHPFYIDESIILPDVPNDSYKPRKNSIEINNQCVNKENIVSYYLISAFLKLIDRIKMEPMWPIVKRIPVVQIGLYLYDLKRFQKFKRH